jgi:hypothetical protein
MSFWCCGQSTKQEVCNQNAVQTFKVWLLHVSQYIVLCVTEHHIIGVSFVMMNFVVQGHEDMSLLIASRYRNVSLFSPSVLGCQLWKAVSFQYFEFF